MAEPTGIELLRAEHLTNHGLRNLNFEYEECFADLVWGHPDPTLEPVEEIRAAVDRTLTHHGWQAIAYGWQAGPAVLRENVAAHLTSIGEGPVDPALTLSTPGASGGLAMLVMLLCRPGDTVLVAEPTYFLVLRILGDQPVCIVGVPCDHEGVLPDALDRAAAGGARLFYCIPTFANPTGICWTDERKREVIDIAARRGFNVVEDDVYRELAFDRRPPRSMWSHDTEGVVIRMGSFSKTLAPGLRVGYLNAPADVVKTVIDCGMLDSGGGHNHFIATVIGDLVGTPDYREIVDRAVASYTQRAAALVEGVGDSLAYDTPRGGYFLWARLPDGVDRDDFLAATAADGVRCSNGGLFYSDDLQRRHVRMSFSLLAPDLLREAGRRVARVLAGIRRG